MFAAGLLMSIIFKFLISALIATRCEEGARKGRWLPADQTGPIASVLLGVVTVSGRTGLYSG